MGNPHPLIIINEIAKQDIERVFLVPFPEKDLFWGGEKKETLSKRKE